MIQSLSSPLKDLRLPALLVALLGALIYANALGNDFAYDDVHIILENPGIQSLETLPEALTEPYWPGPFGRELGLWRPTTTALLALQYAVAERSPVLYHAVNVLGHAVTSGLVVLFLGFLLSGTAAVAGGLLFAVHPVHVEAVANVIGVAEIISTLFYIGALLVLLSGRERAGWGRAAAVGLLYALAFGAKESAVTLPGAVLLVDAARRRLGMLDLAGYLADRWRVYVVMAAVAAALLAIRFQILGSIASPFGPLGADLLEEIPRIWTLAEIWSHYVRLMVFPLDLSSDYSPNVIPISIGWNVANTTGLVVTLGILLGALVAWRRPELRPGSTSARAAAFGVVWFGITISPVSNVFFLSGVLLAERTLYLPSVGFVALAGWLVARLMRDRPMITVAGLATVLVLMGWRSWERTPTWRDNLTVFEVLIDDYPHSGRSQWVLGDLFFQRGRASEGLVSYRAAIDILGPHYQLITEIAKKLIAAEYLESAQRLLEYAYRSEPDLTVAPGLIAVIRSELGDAAGTEEWARIALELEDRDPVRHHLLAWALTEQGRWEEAAQARRNAIDLGEGDFWQQWVSLAYLEVEAGDSSAARSALDSARTKAVSEGGSLQVDSLYLTLLGDTVLPSALVPTPDTLSAPANDSFPTRRPGTFPGATSAAAATGDTVSGSGVRQPGESADQPTPVGRTPGAPPDTGGARRTPPASRQAAPRPESRGDSARPARDTATRPDTSRPVPDTAGPPDTTRVRRDTLPPVDTLRPRRDTVPPVDTLRIRRDSVPPVDTLGFTRVDQPRIGVEPWPQTALAYSGHLRVSGSCKAPWPCRIPCRIPGTVGRQTGGRTV